MVLVNSFRLQFASSWIAYPSAHPLSPSRPLTSVLLVFSSVAVFMKTNIYKRPLFYFFVDLYLVSTYNARIIRVEISFDPTLRLEIF